MSDDSFFGRTVSEGMEALNFDLCEICQKKFPNWVETKVKGKSIEIRLTCNDCHDQYFETAHIVDNEVVRQLDQDEALPETTRPAWVEEFISEQETSGNISAVNTENVVPDETIEQVEDIPNQPTVQENLATWTTDFIREALFGLNVEKWIDDRDLLSGDHIYLTIKTLASLSTSQVANVKIAAIQGFEYIYKKNSSVKVDLIQAINLFTGDLDEYVVNESRSLLEKIS